jgi:SEC-C motif-containing protein
MEEYCPCGNNKSYQDCCEPLINGTKRAETAEQLMRSRYTAYTLAKINYIMKTHHSSSRPLKERNKMLKSMNTTEWLGLVIVKTKAGQAKDSSGEVEFRAIFLEDEQTQVIHENSLFERENGQWVYVSGTHY